MRQVVHSNLGPVTILPIGQKSPSISHFANFPFPITSILFDEFCGIRRLRQSYRNIRRKRDFVWFLFKTDDGPVSTCIITFILLYTCMMTSSIGNIFRVTGPLCGEFIGDQWRGALMFSLICAWINSWVNNCEAGDLGRYRAHYDVTVMDYEYQYLVNSTLHSSIYSIIHQY